MVRSASALLLVLSALALAGCVTTQQRNERYKLRANRTLAGRKPLLVTEPSSEVGIVGVTVVRGPRSGAVVVELANHSGRALSDLPISVGVIAHGRRAYLNRRGGLDFFQTHVAAIAPGARIAWVFTRRRPVARGRPFAVVGDALRSPTRLPRIVAAPAAGRGLRVTLHNTTAVPQYGLPIYALARRGGHYVAAGRATVTELGSSATTTVGVPLVGSRRATSIQLEALPTIYR